jgi:hypothetical protein
MKICKNDIKIFVYDIINGGEGTLLKKVKLM